MTTQIKNSLVFSSDGSLTKDGLQACMLMQIDPDTLKQVSKQELMSQGIEEHIAMVRMEHLQEKRQKRIEMLENTIRSGMLGQLTQVMEAVNNTAPAKNSKTMVQSHGVINGYQGSDSQVEIPLREPLDPEYRLNRKLAKQIYNKERIDRVHNNKEKAELDKQEALAATMKKNKKVEKKKEEEKRNQAREQKVKQAESQEQRQLKKQRLAVEKKAFETTLKEKHVSLMERDKAKKQQIEEERRDREKKRFESDLMDLEKRRIKDGAKQKENAKELLEVQERMKVIDNKRKQADELNAKNRQDLAEQAKAQTRKAEQVLNNHHNIDCTFDLTGVYKDFKRLEKSEKLVSQQKKEQAKKLREKRQEKFAIAKQNQNHVKTEEKDKVTYLKEKDEVRAKIVGEIKEALQEDVDQRKEIALLKKKDQMENLERGKNFHQLYKQKLVERILEKKERAERVKIQQQRIAQICGTQRTRVVRPESQAPPMTGKLGISQKK